MKKDIEFVLFDLKIKKWQYLIIIGILYIFIFPYLINKAEVTLLLAKDYMDYFNPFQIYSSLIFVCFLFIYFKDLLDEEQLELLYCLDKKKKIRYLLYWFMAYQVLLLPIYIITFLYFPFDITINEVMALLFEHLSIMGMFYGVAYFMKSVFVGIGLVIVYIFVFSILFPLPLSLNIYHIYFYADGYSFIDYLIKSIIVSLYYFLGYRSEKKMIK